MDQAALLSAIWMRHNRPPCTSNKTKYVFNKVTCFIGRESENALSLEETEGECLITLVASPMIHKRMLDILYIVFS